VTIFLAYNELLGKEKINYERQYFILKYLVLFFSLFLSTLVSNSQAKIGTYIGKNSSGTVYTTSQKGKKKIAKEYFEEKKLHLFGDSTFIFSFRYFNIGSSIGNEKRYCTGTWKTNLDTLKLVSTFKMKDFCSVQEKYLPTNENDLIKISIVENPDSIKASTWVHLVDVMINSESYGSCKSNDTLYCKLKKIQKIILTSSSPRFMQWNYTPIIDSSNCFTFHLKTSLKDENICLENSKLLIQGDKLIPLDTFDDLYVDTHPYMLQM
jgi:hypothetical protein